jgi:DNA polymerase-4
VYAHVRVHGLEASVEAREHGDEGLPVVLCDEGGHQVTSVSPEASSRGISPGMTCWEAERLCPEVLVAEPDGEKYAYFWQRVLDICGDYTPDLRTESGHELSLDLTGTERLFGSAKQIAQEISNRLEAEVGVVVSAGIGSNRLVARLACDVAKPGQIVEVAPEKAAEFVGKLSVAVLPGVDAEWVQRLRDMGIRRAGELAILPVEAVERALGPWGRRLWKIAHGDDPGEQRKGALFYPEGSEVFSAQAELRPATEERDRVHSALRKAADGLARKLRRQGLVAQRVQVVVVFDDMRKVGARRTLGRATRSAEVIFGAARSLFDRMKLGGRLVRRVRIAAGRLAAGPRGGQLGLPLLQQEERRERLADYMDQVKDRFGEGAVTRGGALELVDR